MAEILTSDITSGAIDGNGVFDQIMKSNSIRLEEEFKKQRIKGPDYSKVYLGAMEAAMQQSIIFILGKQEADKKADLLVKQIEKTDADIALTKQQTLNLIKEGALLDQQIIKIQAEIRLIDAQTLNEGKKGELIDKQIIKMDSEILLAQAQVDKTREEIQLLIVQRSNAITQGEILAHNVNEASNRVRLVDGQRAVEFAKVHDFNYELDGNIIKDTLGNDVQVNGTIGAQIQKLNFDTELVRQRTVTEHSQVNDFPGGQTLGGTILKQQQLFQKQIDGFDRDAEQKLAKIVADTWNVRRSTNSSETSPVFLRNANIDVVLETARSGIGGGSFDPNAPVDNPPIP